MEAENQFLKEERALLFAKLEKEKQGKGDPMDETGQIFSRLTICRHS